MQELRILHWTSCPAKICDQLLIRGEYKILQANEINTAELKIDGLKPAAHQHCSENVHILNLKQNITQP